MWCEDGVMYYAATIRCVELALTGFLAFVGKLLYFVDRLSDYSVGL